MIKWLDTLDTMPRGGRFLFLLHSGEVFVGYKTCNEPPFLQDYRYSDGTQAPWPIAWATLNIPDTGTRQELHLKRFNR